MKKMKAGIIGRGNISGVYFTNLKNSPWVEVVACADLIPDNAKKKAEEFNIPNVYTVEEMLAQTDIEFIINLTIPASHANVDIASLEAGKHVYSEKPLAITLDEALRVLNMADQKDFASVARPIRFWAPAYRRPKPRLNPGLLADLLPLRRL